MKLNTTEKEALKKEFKQNNFLGSEEYTEAVVNYWLAKIDSILEKKEKDIVEDILAECQKDIDFGAEHQQMVSTRGQSRCLKIITKLNNK